MALNLSTTGIVDGQVITAAQITQSIDALTGTEAYNITISGSFNMGSNTTGSGYYSKAVVSDTIRPQNVAVNQLYTVPYLASTGSTSALYYAATGPKYNPVTETLVATNFQGTASWALSASVAISSSVAQKSFNFIPSYIGIDDGTYSQSVAPYIVNQSTPPFVYVSQSTPAFDLALAFAPGTNGQVVTFTPSYNLSDLNLLKIGITASINIFGLDGQTIPAPTNNTANNLFNPSVGSVNSLTFQYIGIPTTPTFNSPGWYLINKNQS